MPAEVINVRTTTASPVVLDEKAKVEMKAKLVRVLERGHLSDRLTITKGDKHFEWVSKDPVDIARLQAMGFKLCQDPDLKANSLHNDGTANISVGDVVLMEAPLELKALLDETKAEMYQQKHGKVKQEDRDFASRIKTTGLPSINESTTTAIDGQSLKNLVSN